MSEALTKTEQRCCHMAQHPVSMGDLASWRKEFASIPRDEKCKDCPATTASFSPA